jgi:DDE superfamily endonuclease
VESFKFSRDPAFDGKLADIVGLYLDPPERALVLCVDEKSQIQALSRTQPALPMWPGLPACMTHYYTRHGTTSLFAALEVASGKVHGRCFKRHTHVEFIAFLESLAKRYPRLELHLICDNYRTHTHPAVTDWLAAHPLPSALHSDQCLMAQPGRTLVRPDHQPGHPPRQLRQRLAPGTRDHSLAHALE